MGFLLLHLGVGSLGWMPARYNASAAWLRHLSTQIPLLEVGLLLVIVAQILLGLRLLIRSGLGIKASRCKEDDRLRYFLQRWSGLILLIFLVVHLALFTLWKGAPSLAATSARFTLGANPFWISFTLLVLAGLAFHAGNGLWTGASVWGVRDRHPRFWLGVATAVGGVITMLGFGAFFAFVR
jgi:succinate dehydrogenase / fumarate reductase cytochrome b subunit